MKRRKKKTVSFETVKKKKFERASSSLCLKHHRRGIKGQTGVLYTCPSHCSTALGMHFERPLHRARGKVGVIVLRIYHGHCDAVVRNLCVRDDDTIRRGFAIGCVGRGRRGGGGRGRQQATLVHEDLFLLLQTILLHSPAL